MEKSQIIESLNGLIIFQINQREFCADIKEVAAIINPKEIGQEDNLKSPEPHLIFDNMKIPILPIQNYFSLNIGEQTEFFRIVLVEAIEKMFGFFVEKVEEIYTMSREFTDQLTFMQDEENPYLMGIINYEQRELMLPNYGRIAQDKIS